MKKDDAKSRFGVSVLHAQIPLSSHRITLDLSDKSHPLYLSKESNTMDPKVTKAIGIKVIVAFCRLFHCRNSLLFDQMRQVLVQGLIGKFRSALPSILGGIGAQFVQSAAY